MIRRMLDAAADGLERRASEWQTIIAEVRRDFTDHGMTPLQIDEAIESMASVKLAVAMAALDLALADAIRPGARNVTPDGKD